MNQLFRFFTTILAIWGLTSCFTGVESTPRITQKDVKKQNVVDIPEKHILENIDNQTPADWKKGKRFYISDNRVQRAAWRIEPLEMADSLIGRTASIVSIDTVPTLTDNNEVELTLKVMENGTSDEDIYLTFRTGMTLAQWLETPKFSLPHAIDMDVVDGAAKRLNGNTYYILSGRRLGINDTDTVGTKYQKVVVRSVEPASESTPLKIIFTDDEGHIASVLITIGTAPTSYRNFETLFSLEDPRLKYKQITDENWELIRHGKITYGMTKDECRLALGNPESKSQFPTTAGMVERWVYPGGVSLQFEDGLLSSFRM